MDEAWMCHLLGYRTLLSIDGGEWVPLPHSVILNIDRDVHTEAVQAALAKHKEWKMAVPMPSKRRSLVVQTSMDAYTPPASTCVQPDLADVLQRPWTRAALFHQCGIRELPPGKCQVMVTSTRRHS
ncbi:disco-interacting protein 2 homolog B-like isoform X10 [Macaca fascicularis]|uniref:disco-interacting protein 2 homolog B-like isoform X10 n=1 Tax=Macaca fascicularis TaxID=9541 RepID=UPI0032B07727